ncbi:pyridoxal-phosphate dependent enzyme [Halovenus sp. WSH3]|uniref:Pyridoxal-phosphate dependent enzyme n=1 Tax=Halovenus carboxidivorans TaxID=2692199 RepID=A0A6B0TD25_9EURY|nr:pyridoxal-phosphate dependent enzyme [Halovenus carboxidivorans]MXR53141.1 pyridoxal-phosphate dependent enzyme [Halovenus carboxidivorans]
MQTTDGFDGFRCLDCNAEFGVDGPSRCEDCGGVLEPVYDAETLADAHERLFDDATGTGLAQLASVLPFTAEALPTIEEGSTPTVDCPTLAEEAGVGAVHLKDEARNATGGSTDREMVVAVAAAAEQGATEVGLPTTGNAGHSAAAYAARAGLDSTSFVPSRATFETKAMINVHGGEMNVVGGRYGDAAEAFESASEDEDWYSLAPFGTPFRHEGAKTIAYELARSVGGAPDAVVHPTAHGTGLLGIYRGFRELASTGAIEAVPRLYAAQPDGCAPIVEAWTEGTAEITPVEHPDTISGALEIPDPEGGEYVLDALDATDGGAVAVEDKELLEAGTTLSQDGVPVSATGATAVAGLTELAEEGVFDGDDSVVLVNPATANREADVLRSHLMSKGI